MRDPYDGEITSLYHPAAVTVAPGEVGGAEFAALASEVAALREARVTRLGDLADVSAAGPVTGQLLRWDGSEWAPHTLPSAVVSTALGIIIGGGEATISTGAKGVLRVPGTMTIREATIDADRTGSIQVDIWRTPSATYPPVEANSICGAKPLAIANASRGGSSRADTAAHWATGLLYGDYLRFNVDSAIGIQQVTITLFCDRSV